MSPSTHTPFTVRHIAKPTDSDVDAIAEVLAAAFHNDEFSIVLTGRDPSLLAPFHKCQVVAASIAGEVYVAEDHSGNILGAAVWFGPGREMFDSEDQKSLALLPLFSQFTSELQTWWGGDFLPHYAQLSENAFGQGVKRGAWYLQDIGVEPAHQRQGIATALISRVREKALNEHMPLCLEAATELNVSIYKRLGLVIQGQGGVSGPFGGFTLCCMLDSSTASA